MDMRAAAELRAAKLLMVVTCGHFEGIYPAARACALSIASELQIAQGRASFGEALRELLIAFPVYRARRGRSATADRYLRTHVVERVKTLENPPQPEALTFLSRLLTGDVPTSSREEGGHSFACFRFSNSCQGPLMAKSVEDTLSFVKTWDWR